jgi:acetylornithine deacetylase
MLRDALAAIDDEEVIELEKDLVRIPSYTIEEHELAHFIGDFLSDQGVEVELQEVPFPRNKKSPNQFSYNVIGRIPGSDDGPSLMFNGHMDHNPIAGRDAMDFSDWKRDPWTPTIEDGYLYGKGCQDEKGGICAFLSAARAIKRAGIRPRGDIVFAPVCGHKTHSAGTKALLESGIKTDMAINSENSGNGIVALHVGVMTAKIHVLGGATHPKVRSVWPDMRDELTTIQRSIQVIQALGQDCVPHQPETSWLTYQPHPELSEFPEHRVDSIESYDLAHQAVHLMFRTVPGQDEQSVQEDLDRLLDRMRQEDPSFRGWAETRLWGPPLDTPYDAPVVDSLVRAHRQVSGDEGATAGTAGRYGSFGDAPILSAAGISTCTYGPGGGLSDLEHDYKVLIGEIEPDERISISDLVVNAKAMTLVAVDLCG